MTSGLSISKQYTYKDYTIKLSKVSNPMYACCPWRYSIVDLAGCEHTYVGIPNYCESLFSAFMKARHRVNWMIKGTYSSKYVPIS